MDPSWCCRQTPGVCRCLRTSSAFWVAPGRAREADRYVVAGKKWLLDATKDQSQPCALMLRAVVEEVGLGGFRRSKLNAARLCAAAAELDDPFGQFRLGQQYEEQSRRSGASDRDAEAAFR